LRVEKILMMERCPECNGNLRFDRASGEVVCGDCGLVTERLEDEGPEWRSFTEEERMRRERTGPAFTFWIGPRTTMEPRSTDMNGLKLKKLQDKLYDGRRAIIAGFQIIEEISREKNLSNAIVEKAKIILRRAADEGLIKGRPVRPVAAASLYASCKMLGYIIRLKEIAESYCTDRKKGERELRRTYKLLRERLKLRIRPSNLYSHADLIMEILNLPFGIRKEVYEELEGLESGGQKWKIGGKNPRCISAAYVLRVCRRKEYPIRAKDVAMAAEISPAALRISTRFLERRIYSQEG
jgi:transcription initiation factor TFIIB